MSLVRRKTYLAILLTELCLKILIALGFKSRTKTLRQLQEYEKRFNNELPAE